MQKLTIIEQLYQDGHLRLALNLADDNIDLLRTNPRAEMLRGQMLLETGELEDGFEVLNQLVAIIRENQQRPEFAGLQWHTPVALSQLAKGAYPSAIDAWRDKLDVYMQFGTSPEISRSLLQTLPLVPAAETRIGAAVPHWPLSHLANSQMPMTALPGGQVEPRFMMAMAGLESGSIANARFLLQSLISEGGENRFRPLAEIYLRLVSDDAATLIADARADLWEDFVFPEVPPTTESDSSPQPAGEKPDAEPPTDPPAPDSATPEIKTPAEQTDNNR